MMEAGGNQSRLPHQQSQQQQPSTKITASTRSPLLYKDSEAGGQIASQPSNHQELIRLHEQVERIKCLKRAVIVLATICFLLAASVISLLVYYFVFHPQQYNHNIDEPLDFNARSSSQDICQTSECIHAASEVLESLDQTVDPCQDFYGFACNGWIEKHSIPKGLPAWSLTDQRNDDNMKILRSLLEAPINATSPTSTASEAEIKSQIFYRSCIDNDGDIEKLGSAPISEIIRQVGGWNLTGQVDLTTFDLKKKILSVQKFSTDALFNWYVREGLHNGQKHEIFVRQGGLTLNRELYTDPGAREALHKFMAKVVNLIRKEEAASGNLTITKSKHDIAKEIDDLVKFEQALALRMVRADQISASYLSMDDANLSASLGVAWPSWQDFFNAIIVDNDIKVDAWTRAWFQVSYLSELKDMLAVHLTEVSDRADFTQYNNDDIVENRARFFNTVNNYLTWCAIRPYIQSLSRPFRKARGGLIKNLLGSQGQEERWKTCVLNTNSALGFAIAPSFVRTTFDLESKEKSHDILHAIIAAFKVRLDELDWMQGKPEMVSAIKEKIDAATHLVGYPDFIFNATALDEMYRNLNIVENQFFQNTMSLYRYRLKRNLDLLRKNVDKTKWPITFPPVTVNAFYMYSRNQILFPAGILQQPFFSKDQPMSLNFGHTGTFMGHELLHGFDNIGRLYGPDGVEEKWLPQNVEDVFEARTQCFIEQYTKEVFMGAQTDGGLTLAENIADNGGLTASIKAYEMWSENNNEAVLPGLNLTHSQLVFVGFARSFCSTSRKKAYAVKLKLDPHSPNHVRVNTAVGNLPQFAKAFHCPLSEEKSETCTLW